ncbi:3-phosphoshikimate 1-carboxyvinyltransferase [Candidatus Termititenax aidoneus]|uniref:3-phosphoshikimate 1-carboxyvinyltransferase n=1 Tax=Termititenax aidoneus TaxID=2218524 RepID=A0A388TAN1_TERA1|nr:3-phosphoshikimate 1-carboxyvinyltransferase [Candidatus Termititenax aidoneus]
MKITGAKKGLRGALMMPGDKSISHRAVILAALADGKTEISGFLRGQDCLHTLKIFKMLGVEYRDKKDKLLIKGRGLKGLRKPDGQMDVGNSGTAFRLLAGVLAGQDFTAKLTGDESIQKRPMGRVIEPLHRMGAEFNGDKAPLVIVNNKNTKQLVGIAYESPLASAQVKSAILLAGLYARGETSVTEPALSRDHTERMFKTFGVRLRTAALPSGKHKVILPNGKHKLKGGLKIKIPGDFSAAAFFIVAALIVPGSKLLLKNVGVNPTRIGLLDVLKKMGAKIIWQNKKMLSGEPVADLQIVHSPLKAVEIGGELLLRMIDEAPIFAVAAALAKGRTVVKNAEELRVKESDRIKTVVEMLKGFGVSAAETSDGFVIDGNPELQIAAPLKINSHYDHRIAMSAAVFGLLNQKETTITDDKCIETSFPGFAALLQKAAR